MTDRKDDHLRLALQQQDEPQRSTTDFDDVEIVHDALGGIDASLVSLETSVGGLRWPMPFCINGMTGGTEKTAAVNRQLAIAARATGVPIATGSMARALDDPSTLPGFRVLRDENPDGIVMANIGVGRSADDARRVVDLLGADALQVHVNAAQETVMPEGGRDFSSWPASLAAIVDGVDVPVIVKEVGAGLSRRTLVRLVDMGVQVADVGGVGGTDFVRVENDRRAEQDLAYLRGWGQSAAACLLDAPWLEQQPGQEAAPMQLISSGGVRTPLDVLRSLALGASGAGVAGAFLSTVMAGGPDALVQRIETWRDHLTALMALVGASTPGDVATVDVLVRGRLRETCELRGIDLRRLARRSAAHDEASRGGRA